MKGVRLKPDPRRQREVPRLRLAARLLWVRLQPDAFCLDAANPVGLKADRRDEARESARRLTRGRHYFFAAGVAAIATASVNVASIWSPFAISLSCAGS